MTIPSPWAMTSLILVLAALCPLLRVSANSVVDAEVLSAVRASMDAGQREDGDGSISSLGECLFQARSVECLERRAARIKQVVTEEQKAIMAKAVATDPQIQRLMREAVDQFGGLLPTTTEEERNQEDVETGRGHKLKKKIHKLIKIIKIIIFIVVMALKMVFLMFAAQTFFQFKLVAITMMILLIKKYYLWVEWKHKKEEKKAVVYYEHAQHQHHYDESDHFHDGLGGLLGNHAHKDVETPTAPSHSGWGGLWSKRSYGNEMSPAHTMAFAGQIPPINQAINGQAAPSML